MVRTANSPAGDWAELLVAAASGGTLAPNNVKSYDVLCVDGKKIQVKARMLDPEHVGSNTLSAIRTWDFDELFVVLFDPGTFEVLAAASIPVADVEPRARYSKHANAWTVRPTRDLLELGTDWTAQLRDAASTY